MDKYADGIFPHLFKACQLLVIIAHEVIRLLPFAPTNKCARLLLKRARPDEVLDRTAASRLRH